MQNNNSLWVDQELKQYSRAKIRFKISKDYIINEISDRI